jgi:hypothetical protein
MAKDKATKEKKGGLKSKPAKKQQLPAKAKLVATEPTRTHGSSESSPPGDVSITGSQNASLSATSSRSESFIDNSKSPPVTSPKSDSDSDADSTTSGDLGQEDPKHGDTTTQPPAALNQEETDANLGCLA